MVMLSDIPTFLDADSIAEATPKSFFATELIIALAFGDEKKAQLKPSNKRLIIMRSRVAVSMALRSRDSPITAITMVAETMILG